MSKKRKSNKVVIEFDLPPKIVEYIDRMVETELWGVTREEVCLTLIREGIRRHLETLPAAERWALLVGDGPEFPGTPEGADLSITREGGADEPA